MGGKYTEAQARATAEYMKDKHTIRVVVTKEKAELIKKHASASGESMNGFIKRAINETMERDNKERGTNGKIDEKVEK